MLSRSMGGPIIPQRIREALTTQMKATRETGDDWRG